MNTVTAALPAVVRSLAGIVAVREVALTNSVDRAAPFHCTTEPAMKLEPLTVNVKPGLPAAAELGLRAVIAGTGLADELMVKLSGADVPPPGAGLNTVTAALPAVVRSLAGIVAVREVALTNTVDRAAPFHCTTEPVIKLEPVTVSVKPGLTAAAELGLRAVTAGTGLIGTTTLIGTELQAACNASPLYCAVIV